METEPILILHPNTRRVDDVNLKKIQIESILITIFEEGVFGKPEVLLDVYHHFRGERELPWIQTAIKKFGLTHSKIVASRMLEIMQYI